MPAHEIKIENIELYYMEWDDPNIKPNTDIDITVTNYAGEVEVYLDKDQAIAIRDYLNKVIAIMSDVKND